MKLITLNIWGGRLEKPLLRFIKTHSRDIDIFCFQEVFHQGRTQIKVHAQSVMDIYTKISHALPQFTGYFTTPQDNEFGLATFIRTTIPVAEVGERFVYRWKNANINGDAKTLGKNIQYTKIDQEGSGYTIINFHGLWIGIHKDDTSDRLSQSRKIYDFTKKVKGKIILCGDFNLSPATQSLKILEKNMRNLIKEFGITSTRSHLYTKPNKFADYILVSPEVIIKSLNVLPDAVSDHSPLYIEFN